MTLSLSFNRDGDTIAVGIDGEIDLSNADNVDQEIIAHGSEEGVTLIVVDLARVPFMDSAGINALLKARRWADDHHRSLRVTGADGLVREVLELTGVLAHLTEAHP